MVKFTDNEITLITDVMKFKRAQLERERRVWRAAHQHDFAQEYDLSIGAMAKVIQKLEGLK